jgi:hypothetical protein
MMTQYPIASDADGAVEQLTYAILICTRLAVADRHDHLPGEPSQPANLRPVGEQWWRRPRRAVEVGQVSTQCSFGQDKQAHLVGPGGVDEVLDADEVGFEVPVETRCRGSHPKGVHAAPSPVTESVTTSVSAPSGQRKTTPWPATSSPQSALTAGDAGGGGRCAWSAVSIPNPGKQVNQSPTVACAGLGTAATSSTAWQPLASASMPRVPTNPAIETSLAAAGRATATEPSIARSSGVRRCELESHW